MSQLCDASKVIAVTHRIFYTDGKV